jgi:hypothetical protein
LAFEIIAILHNTRLAMFIKLLKTVSKGLFRNRSQNSCQTFLDCRRMAGIQQRLLVLQFPISVHSFVKPSCVQHYTLNTRYSHAYIFSHIKRTTSCLLVLHIIYPALTHSQSCSYVSSVILFYMTVPVLL